MTEIKISELSIGDWVRDGNGIIAKVRGIENWSDGYILNVQTVSGSICTLSATGALPILLTPEILEKNGFEQDGRKYSINIFAWRISVWLYHNGDCEVEISQPYDTSGESFYADIRLPKPYVHQLQHALRLAGVDKEIEL